MSQNVLIVAGEASADLHAAHLVQSLKSKGADLRFFGVGGEKLIAEGVDVCVRAERLNVVGGAEWLGKVVDVLRAYRQLKREISHRRPSIAILLDLPDFNLRLSRYLQKLGIPVVYYISPQVWAWRRYRLSTIRKTIDKMLVVFPFEKDFYDSNGVPVEFVGHPLVEQIQPRKQYRTQSEIVRGPRLAVLPGSRPSELQHHASLLNQFFVQFKACYPSSEIRLPVASTLQAAQVRALFPNPEVRIVSGDSREVLVWSDLAVVASGTATLETALLGTPFCLFYKLSRSTTWFVQRVLRYSRFFGMPNLLHSREVVKEYLHDGATAENLMGECKKIIDDEPYRQRVVGDILACRKLLGDPGASSRAAGFILERLNQINAVEGSFANAPS